MWKRSHFLMEVSWLWIGRGRLSSRRALEVDMRKGRLASQDHTSQPTVPLPAPCHAAEAAGGLQGSSPRLRTSTLSPTRATVPASTPPRSSGTISPKVPAAPPTTQPWSLFPTSAWRGLACPSLLGLQVALSGGVLVATLH